MTGMSKTQVMSWAERNLSTIEDVATNGLPSAYKDDVVAFLFDFWAGDMPWNEIQFAQVHAAMLVHPFCEATFASFEARFGRPLTDENDDTWPVELVEEMAEHDARVEEWRERYCDMWAGVLQAEYGSVPPTSHG